MLVVKEPASYKIANDPGSALAIVIEVHQAISDQSRAENHDAVIAAAPVAITLFTDRHRLTLTYAAPR